MRFAAALTGRHHGPALTAAAARLSDRACLPFRCDRPDGALLLCVGTSSGDQHTLCAFDWATSTLLYKTVAMIARPLGVFNLLTSFAYAQQLTKAQAVSVFNELMQAYDAFAGAA